MATMNHPAEMPQKPSFLSSTLSGISGAFKGGIIGAVIGAAAAAAVTAITLLIIGGTGGIGFLGGLGVAGAAAIGGSALGSIGAAAGAMTGVVRSREANQPSAEDVVNVAKISFAQGVNVGHQMDHKETHHHRKNEHVRAETRAMEPQQITH